MVVGLRPVPLLAVVDALTEDVSVTRERWVCDFCGSRGNSDEPSELILCPTCGEPVTRD